MNQGDRARGVAAFTAIAALLLATLLTTTAGAAFRRCPTSERGRPLLCGRVVVPLDRSGALPGRVSLRVRVQPARTSRTAGTIVALAGGPGQAAAPLVRQIAAMLGSSARSRRVVTFDQRGTGDSGRLRCKGLSTNGSAALNRAVANCARQLGPRRAAYTTSASVDDVEAVRAALGVDRIALFGVSYGTKVALDYAARYPQHVSRLILDSVVLPEGVDPFMRSTLTAVPRVLRQLCAGRSACRFTRDAGADLGRLVAKIGRDGVLRGVRYDGRGRARTVKITREHLLGLLVQGDFDPFSRIAVPAAVRSALEGDTAPLAKLLGGQQTGLDSDSGDSDALFVATTCEDGGVPWPAGTPIGQREQAYRTLLAALPAASLAPFDRDTLRRSGIDYCRDWPESPIVQPASPLPDVPTLILSGDDDLRTPRRDAETLAARMPSAQLVTVPETGHSVLGADLGKCSSRALTRFFADRRVRDCRLTLPRAFRPQAQAPRSLSQVRPARGVPGRAGRTLTATGVTLSGFSQEFVVRMFALLLGDGADVNTLAFGGLRGGYARVGDDGFVLHRYSIVDGVHVSFRVGASAGADDAIVVHVGGRDAARGTLRLGRRVVGRLGGRRVDMSLDALLATPASSASAGDGGAVALAFPTSGELRAQLQRARRLAGALQPLEVSPSPLLAGRSAR
ncbi:alpha/beta fold hydrolase [Conexibacter sp. JD483]|uniref:alpha/beta hydrolase n=1 Tax=unclassified Conexibacter TaxID=2627773 RepID=UPI002721A494|nr:MULTISPECIES: alpha/beta fold hydrolase [unclassified Conexibacter]MDO8186213.1 alpha/beta fold hydrolase [Conexibacter sp. CPCC 205706]MDO8199720.1 alpha/beta fold hydrolase [Conexibacter sp. CPCC 205762]MDR9368188.1 alpha/beta fold hydrolase [Conexibacter sp. JD483]